MSGTPSPLELHLASGRAADARRGGLATRSPHRPGFLARLRARRDAGEIPADTVTIRRARDRDALTIVLLLSRAGGRLPAGDRILADVDGRAVAAVDIATGTTVADPAKATADVLSLLRLRAAQLQATRRPALEH
jgi:hypothetical protein